MFYNFKASFNMLWYLAAAQKTPAAWSAVLSGRAGTCSWVFLIFVLRAFVRALFAFVRRERNNAAMKGWVLDSIVAICSRWKFALQWTVFVFIKCCPYYKVQKNWEKNEKFNYSKRELRNRRTSNNNKWTKSVYMIITKRSFMEWIAAFVFPSGSAIIARARKLPFSYLPGKKHFVSKN